MILLVEGEDDEHVVEHLYREVFDSEPPFKISNEQGYSKLLKTLPLHLRGSGLLALGVLADANDDPAERWREIVDVAAEEGVRLPGAPDPSGTVVGDRPRVGVWPMPDNQGPGELEDFALKLIPGSDRVWPLAKSYVEGIPEKSYGRNSCTGLKKVACPAEIGLSEIDDSRGGTPWGTVQGFGSRGQRRSGTS